MKKYDILLCDPPWSYRYCATKSRQIENQYDTMELEDIKKIKIPSKDNSVLYLWATAPKLAEAIEVMIAWGFDYKSCCVWDKEMIGMGYWFRGQHELLLVGVKGIFSPPSSELRISSVIRIKRGEHSDKPDYFKAMIDKWYPDMTKLEMFARSHTPLFKDGWKMWGDEIKSDIKLC